MCIKEFGRLCDYSSKLGYYIPLQRNSVHSGSCHSVTCHLDTFLTPLFSYLFILVGCHTAQVLLMALSDFCNC